MKTIMPASVPEAVPGSGEKPRHCLPGSDPPRSPRSHPASVPRRPTSPRRPGESTHAKAPHWGAKIRAAQMKWSWAGSSSTNLRRIGLTKTLNTINQSINQSTNQPTNPPNKQTNKQTNNQTINQSNNPTINQINQSIKQSINQSTNQPTNQSINQSIKQSTN